MLRDVVFLVEDRLLDRPLADEESGDYYWVPLGNVDGLLTHRIGSPPSFDHIVNVSKRADRKLPELLDRPAESPLDARSSADWLDELGLSWQQELYLETADFAAPH